MRATICVDIESDDEMREVDKWFLTWRDKISVSEDKGCGWCVRIWDVEGPPEAIAARRFRKACGSSADGRMQLQAAQVEVDGVPESFSVPESACSALDALHLGVDRLAAGVGGP